MSPELSPELLTDPETGESLYGLCGHCARSVDNHDPDHRVSSIFDGGLGVECVHRGDITPAQAGPLGPALDDQPHPRETAMVLCFAWEPMRLPPPWYLPGERPACGAVLDVPAEATNDNRGRRFVCDLPTGHAVEELDEDRRRFVCDPPAVHEGLAGPEDRTGTMPLPGLGELGDLAQGDRHRAVLSPDSGRVFTWPAAAGPVPAPERLDTGRAPSPGSEDDMYGEGR